MADHAATAGAHESPEELRKHIKGYVVIGGILYVLTVVTVLVAYKQLDPVPAIVVALVIATTKATLVALYFMHLMDERKLIYWTLLLTASFFVLCMALPSSTTFEGVGDPTAESRTRAEKALRPHEHAAGPEHKEGAH